MARKELLSTGSTKPAQEGDFDDRRHPCCGMLHLFGVLIRLGFKLCLRMSSKEVDVKMIGTYDMRDGFDSSDKINVDTYPFNFGIS